MEIEKQKIQHSINENYLFPPEICTWGSKKFSINKLNGNSKTKFCFRCTKHNCKKIYPLRQNCFYDNFKFFTFDECHEIFKCFMSNNFNAKETIKFLSENPKINTTEATVRRFITGIRM